MFINILNMEEEKICNNDITAKKGDYWLPEPTKGRELTDNEKIKRNILIKFYNIIKNKNGKNIPSQPDLKNFLETLDLPKTTYEERYGSGKTRESSCDNILNEKMELDQFINSLTKENYKDIIKNKKESIKKNCESLNNNPLNKLQFEACCKCADTKTGGSLNLTKEQAKNLIKQIGGNSIKSTYVSYNNNNAKIIGFNKETHKFIIQTGTGLENVSVHNVFVNGKRVI